MKRLFDIIFSIIGLVLLLPVMIIVLLAVKLTSRGPALFAHERIGMGFRPFKLLKFRTMYHSQEGSGPQITTAADSRITPVGKLLRKTKLDELPQLLNVLTGDISFVGPRPEVRKYVEIFKEDYREILSIRPGITDYAAIEFRNEEDILAGYEDAERGYVEEVLPAKIKLYKRYVNSSSLMLDIIIIVKTLLAIAMPRRNHTGHINV